MFSDPQIQRLTSRFVTISIDPRDPNVDREPFKHKATNYVPEIVCLDVRGNEERVVARMEERTVKGATRVLATVLGEYQE